MGDQPLAEPPRECPSGIVSVRMEVEDKKEEEKAFLEKEGEHGTDAPMQGPEGDESDTTYQVSEESDSKEEVHLPPEHDFDGEQELKMLLEEQQEAEKGGLGRPTPDIALMPSALRRETRRNRRAERRDRKKPITRHPYKLQCSNQDIPSSKFMKRPKKGGCMHGGISKNKDTLFMEEVDLNGKVDSLESSHGKLYLEDDRSNKEGQALIKELNKENNDLIEQGPAAQAGPFVAAAQSHLANQHLMQPTAHDPVPAQHLGLVVTPPGMALAACSKLAPIPPTPNRTRLHP